MRVVEVGEEQEQREVAECWRRYRGRQRNLLLHTLSQRQHPLQWAGLAGQEKEVE